MVLVGLNKGEKVNTKTNILLNKNSHHHTYYIIYNPSPGSLSFHSGVLLSELLNAFEMGLLLRMQTLVLFWI